MNRALKKRQRDALKRRIGAPLHGEKETGLVAVTVGV